MKRLFVIVGPTASGKTALAVRLARLLDTEVVSADSRQFFREMRIGTARPTADEMEGIPHHLLGSHSIVQPYNVAQYERDALEVLERIYLRRDHAVLVGGSGLYVQAVCQGIDELPAADPALRAALQAQWAQEGLEGLLAELAERDPVYWAAVDRQNPRRVLRALEVIRQAGVPFSSLRSGQPKPRPFACHYIGIQWPREALYARIDARMDLMLAEGLRDEALALYEHRQHQALQTVGYREIFGWKEDLYDWPTCVSLLKQNSRRYAKRQITWFGQNPDIQWFGPDQWPAVQAHIHHLLHP